MHKQKIVDFSAERPFTLISSTISPLKNLSRYCPCLFPLFHSQRGNKLFAWHLTCDKQRNAIQSGKVIPGFIGPEVFSKEWAQTVSYEKLRQRISDSWLICCVRCRNIKHFFYLHQANHFGFLKETIGVRMFTKFVKV